MTCLPPVTPEAVVLLCLGAYLVVGLWLAAASWWDAGMPTWPPSGWLALIVSSPVMCVELFVVNVRRKVRREQ